MISKHNNLFIKILDKAEPCSTLRNCATTKQSVYGAFELHKQATAWRHRCQVKCSDICHALTLKHLWPVKLIAETKETTLVHLTSFVQNLISKHNSIYKKRKENEILDKAEPCSTLWNCATIKQSVYGAFKLNK